MNPPRFGVLAIPLILSLIVGGKAEEWKATPQEEEKQMSTTSSYNGSPLVGNWSRPPHAHLEIDMIFNVTDIDDVVDLVTDFHFMTFILSLACAIAWVIYIIFYHSRIMGLVLTKVANLFVKEGYVSIGSISIGVLSGKIMFREYAFITEDFSLRIQDGWLIFRWWKSYAPKDISEDVSDSDTRLSMSLNGLECHLYNRCEMYSRLERFFGLDLGLSPSDGNLENGKVNNNQPTTKTATEEGDDYSWRDLIPAVKMELSRGRIVFGNMLIPHTLALVIDEAKLIYTTKTATSRLDKFMHVVQGRAEHLKVVLSQSPKYRGPKDEPPRLMGEGFNVAISNKVEYFLYMDEPGLVPPKNHEAETDPSEKIHPKLGVDIKCGKGTNFNYGPWADRQREHLHKLFFPQDYQERTPTPAPLPGEPRLINSFDIKLSLKNDSKINILFNKDQETKVIHINVGYGTHVEMIIPWVIEEDGYTNKITGQLNKLKSSTSLQYRNLWESETLQFSLSSHIPIHWNEHQEWLLELQGNKTSASFTFAHKWFLQAFVNDWLSKSPRPDILNFVPYTWKINASLKEFEVVIPVSEYNWIDCSSQDYENTENELLAAYGEQIDLTMDLPFTEFLPETVPISIKVQLENGFLSFFVPPVSTAFVAVQSLAKTAKIRNVDGHGGHFINRPDSDNIEDAEERKGILGKLGGNTKEWMKCQPSKNWVECGSVPNCVINVRFIYHPMPPLGPRPLADMTTEEKEDILLDPIRIPGLDRKSTKHDLNTHHSDFDPASLPPDLVTVEVEVGSGELLMYGSLLKVILNWKETIFGDHQQFIDMEILSTRAANIISDKPHKPPKGSGLDGQENIQNSSMTPKAIADCRTYRPLHVNVSVIANNILTHLLKHCNEDDPPCPTVFVNKIGFELDKRYQETKLQVLISPAMIRVSDTQDRSESGDEHLGDGHLMLSGLQVRGHSMFSNEGRSLDEDTLEYAFLLEIQLGRLSGRLSTPHLENILSAAQCLVLPVLDVENSLRSPHSFQPCHHGNNQFDCDETVTSEGSQPTTPRAEPFPSGPAFPGQKDPGEICPTSEDIKYGMVRVSLDAVDLYLVESGTALSLWVSPIRFAKCNLHGQLSREGCTLLIPKVHLRHFVMISPAYTKRFRFSDASAFQGLGEPLRNRTSITGENSWLEVGSVDLGPLCLEVGLRGSSQLCQTQRKFLFIHDLKTKRLWFLWNSGGVPGPNRKCGCSGGCTFFGSNSGGSAFLQPSEQDWMTGVNVACFQVNKTGEDPGFGQSILKDDVLLFDTPPYTTTGADDNTQIKLHPPLTSITHQFQINRRRLWAERNRLSDNKLGQLDIPKDRRSMDEKLLKYLENNDQRQSHPGGSLDDSLDSLSDFDSISSSLLNVHDPLVNLQIHLNKPITESSVLMPCYLNHLSQLKCDNWNMTAPKCKAITDSLDIASIAKVQAGKVTPLRCKYIPCFEPTLDGFTNLTMTDRQTTNLGHHDTTPKTASILRRRQLQPSQMTQSFDFPATGVRFSEPIATSNDPPPATLPTEEFYQAVLNCGWEEDFDVPTSSERTTFVIRTENDVNILASPMLLEAVQKLVEAITPTLSSLHPLTVVNNLHGDCLAQVEGENLLKKEKSDFLTRLYKSKGNTVLREQATGELTLNQSILFEQTQQTTIQGSVSVPKVNLTLLQASVVEDVISFSALDNVRDLMCVSMMAVAIESTKVYLLFRGHEKKTVQVLRRPTILPKLEKKRGWRSKVTNSESILDEPVFSENSEKQTEFASMSVDISRIHGQLRRLKNDSSIMREAVITAIPNQHSKVLFRFSKIPSCLMTQTSMDGPLQRQDATVEEPAPTNSQISSEDKLGFIMFECGLEGISFKGVKNDDSLGEKYRKTLKKNEAASVTIFNELDPSGDKETNTPEGKKDEAGPPKCESGQEDGATDNKSKGAGIASCVIKLKSIWNNFAAPPRSPITKKIDCTKMDWNLVSTTSTAINAWLNPINQFTLAIGAMQRGFSRRTTGLLASMMADAVGIQSIHHHNLASKYNKLTPMAKTLLEDPSCQLCLVLRRYIAQTDLATIERNMTESELPQLSTLRQGVIVMSRQWKNELYTPLLLEHNLRSPRKSKHFSVTFAESESEGTDGESENDIIDERTNLLDVEEGNRKPNRKPNRFSVWEDPAGHPRSMDGQRHFSSEESREENLLLEAHTQFPQHPGLTLLDSHVIFKPLLTGMGLMPHQIIGYSFDQLGSHVSFKAAVDQLRIDIVESEPKDGDGSTPKSGRGRKPTPEFNFMLNVPPDMPTFLCQNISFEGDFQKSADMDSDVLNRRNIIRMSRNYWKKQAKSSIIFSINVGCISQQVNMRLLRLVHQITTTFLNVQETQLELKKQMPLIAAMKEDRSSSSGSSSDEEAEPDGMGKLPESSGESSTNIQNNLQAPASEEKSRRISSTLIERTQSFAQRLKKKNSRKSKTKSGGPVTVENSPQIQISPPAPNCWRTIYYLLDLYAPRPEAKEVTIKKPLTPLSSVSFTKRLKAPAALPNETPRVSVFGIACIQRTRLLATLSGLKLEAEIRNLQASSSYKNVGASVESSLTGHVGHSTIMLLEGIAPEQKTVVSASIGQSEVLYSSQCSSLKDSNNSALLTVGPITIDIPQHPVVLHGMMTRSRNRLSTTLQEFRVNRAAARISKVATIDEVDFGPIHNPPRQPIHKMTEPKDEIDANISNLGSFQMKFTVALESLGITAALLPSLQARYKMEMIKSCGVTGNKIEFQVKLPVHSLSFTTKLTMENEVTSLPGAACINFPQIDMNAEYIRDEQGSPKGVSNVELPGSYLSATVNIGSFEHSLSTDLLNHLVFVQKVFRKEVNEVVLKMSGGEKPSPVQANQSQTIAGSGSILFDFRFRLQGVHITATTPTQTAVRLETGLLKFKVSNRDKPDKKNHDMQTPHLGRAEEPQNPDKVFVKGHVNINLSLGQIIRNPVFEEAEPEYQQYAFFKTQVGLKNMSSGGSTSNSAPASPPSPGEDKDKKIVIVTVTRPLIYVQPIAVDKAILVWLNYKTAFDYWNEQRSNLTREVNYCTSPSDPISEQHLWEPSSDIPPRRHRPQAQSSPEAQPPAFPSSMLFLKLKVDDLGISVPLNPSPLGLKVDAENRGAIMVTLKKTSISACSSGSLVSKGTFSQLCIRFTEDMMGMDNWMPNLDDPDLMNVCLVSEGTYDFCSRTTSMKTSGGKNPELFLNLQWQMDGVDMHVDGNIGKQLSALGYTLTTLAAFDQEDDADDVEAPTDEEPMKSTDVPDAARKDEPVMLRKRRTSHTDNQGFLTVPNVARRKKKSLQEMHERISMIEDLDRAGTSRNQVEEERKKLEELQNEASRDFKRELFKKLRRQSTVRRSGSPENFGRDGKSSAQRSKSLVAKPNSDKLSEWRQHKSKTVVPVVGFGKVWPEENEAAFGDTARNDGQDEIDSIVLGTSHELKPGGGQMSAASSTYNMKPEEPNVNLILDVKVFINSGKCVLHAKTKSNEDEKVSPQEKKRRWRSGSAHGSLFNINSPISRSGMQYLSSPKLKSPIGIPPGFLTDVTIFRIPGLDVKIHYGSHIHHEASGADQGLRTATSGKPKAPIGKPTFTQKHSYPGGGPGTKRASMFAWITLHSVPEETVISPHILDFLDQTLAAMPVIQPNANLNMTPKKVVETNDNGNDDEGDGVTSASYETFPVDVVVYFHMKSSTFRFSCQPVSRMECVLRLPSLDIVFSSKGEEEEYEYTETKTTTTTGKQQHGLRHRKSAAFAAPPPQSSSIVVGFSLTGCLSDFSLNIFHPYGAAAKKVGNWSPLSDKERKDSVSVNVEFVKFHLSRRRKEHFKSLGLPTNQLPTSHEAAIHFSTIIDIGSASLKYDMRRLTEILAFPKAWYRRSLVRRVFLGKMSTTPVQAGDEIQESPEMKKEDIASGSQAGGGMKRQTSTQSASLSALETLLLFTVNFTKLNVQMNMGNVMGNVDWLIRDATSEGKLSIGSTGHKNLYIGVGLNSSYIEAKGGIVAGTIELSKLSAYLKGREDSGVEPQHTVGLQLHSLELELDYMGSSALVGRASGLQIKLEDEWKVQHGDGGGRHSVLATYRPATIYIHGDMGWDQFQMIISKSSTVDLFKMYYKLEEFFKQQFRSSKWVLGNMLHDASSDQLTPTTKRRLEDSAKNILQVEPRRHWQQALEKVNNLWIRSIFIPFPESGTVLGGTMNLHGNNISLACFHGLNFKAKNWALFSVKQPLLSFSTEAQETRHPEGGQGSSGGGGVHVIQNLNFSLGQHNNTGMGGTTVESDCRAMVCKITRNVMHAPQFRTLYEWFHYAFAPSEIDDVSRFPSLEMERAELRSPIRLPDPNHNKEVIFALPSMELFFKTEQLQDSSTNINPEPNSKKPLVECSFITEFGDHIFVSVDVEAFLFLHDLILSYVKEKDKLVSAQLAGGRRLGSSLTPPPSPNMDRGTKVPRDWRDYHCKTWHLEPTVRLRSWAGKAIEPYGVDYILQKLGFSHARVTIPKWIQRGCCDPLDQALSLLIFGMVDLARRKETSGKSRPNSP